jgi:hypothetical protein
VAVLSHEDEKMMLLYKDKKDEVKNLREQKEVKERVQVSRPVY